MYMYEYEHVHERVWFVFERFDEYKENMETIEDISVMAWEELWGTDGDSVGRLLCVLGQQPHCIIRAKERNTHMKLIHARMYSIACVCELRCYMTKNLKKCLIGCISFVCMLSLPVDCPQLD